MDKIRNSVEAGIKERVFPGTVVIYGSNLESVKIIKAGKLTYEDGSFEVTKDTIFDIASLTKIFTSTLILILISKNKLKLDTEVGKILNINSFPGITVKHLLTHTAGLQMSFSELENRSRKYIENKALSTGPATQPGSALYYSNHGYYLLGKIIEKVSGLTLPKAFEQFLFIPLELEHTFFNPLRKFKNKIAPTEISTRGLVHGYVHDEGTRALGGISGYAGLFSTSEDLFKLGLLWLNKGVYNGIRLIDDDLVKEAVTNHFPKAENLTISKMHFGYGWRLYNTLRMGKYASKDAYEFTGFTGPSLHIDPSYNIIIVILNNRTYPIRGEREVWWKAHSKIAEAIYKSIK